jgi:hypothetical protein
MLNSSYAAVQQFQSQISSVKNFQQLTNLGKLLDISISAQISSSSVWIACLDFTNRNLQGTMEISIQPKLSTKLGVFEAKTPRTLRLEFPSQVRFCVFEYRFLELMKQSILSISENRF